MLSLSFRAEKIKQKVNPFGVGTRYMDASAKKIFGGMSTRQYSGDPDSAELRMLTASTHNHSLVNFR
jgi:hypothetical protein